MAKLTQFGLPVTNLIPGHASLQLHHDPRILEILQEMDIWVTANRSENYPRPSAL